MTKFPRDQVWYCRKVIMSLVIRMDCFSS